MNERSLEILLGTITDQQYLFHILVKLLVEKGVISSGEVQARYNQKERFHFGHDLLEQLVASGLKIGTNSPSSSPQESASVPPRATTAEVDPESK